MKARDIMTSSVITVAPDTPVRFVATLLLENRISAVPVLDDGRLVGIVSEGDLLHRVEIGTDAPRPSSWWERLFHLDRPAAAYVKSHARRASDIMTHEVISVSADTRVPELASLLESRHIKRVPVLEDGQLVGIVSRADLVQALASSANLTRPATPPIDEAIKGRLTAELARQPWWRPTVSNVVVDEGVVHYWGLVDDESERDAARVAAENVPGVRGVEDHRVALGDTSSAL